MGASNIIQRNGSTYTVYRKTSGVFVNGTFEPGNEESLEITAVVLPLSPRELQMIPEGARAKDMRILYTTTMLKIGEATGESADEVSVDGRIFAVSNLYVLRDLVKVLLVREEE